MNQDIDNIYRTGIINLIAVNAANNDYPYGEINRSARNIKDDILNLLERNRYPDTCFFRTMDVWRTNDLRYHLREYAFKVDELKSLIANAVIPPEYPPLSINDIVWTERGHTKGSRKITGAYDKRVKIYKECIGTHISVEGTWMEELMPPDIVERYAPIRENYIRFTKTDIGKTMIRKWINYCNARDHWDRISQEKKDEIIEQIISLYAPDGNVIYHV